MSEEEDYQQEDLEWISEGRKVLHLAAQMKIKADELAIILGVSRTAPYSYARKNKSANPSPQSIDNLIRHLLEFRKTQVPRGWFFDGQPGDAPLEGPDAVFLRDPASAGTAARSLAAGDMVRLPLWTGVMAGEEGDCTFLDDTNEDYLVPAFLTGGDIKKHVVAVVTGFSMFPRVRPGEHIVLRIDTSPPPNAIVVARKPESGNYIKAYRIYDQHRVELHSLNDEFPKIINLKGWELRGYAVAILHLYDPGVPNIEWDFGRPLKA